jgi:hypothetical protein
MRLALKERLRSPYTVLYIIFIYFIVFAFAVDTPGAILNGLLTIARSGDILITDYIEIAGIGASLVNSALVNLIFVTYLARARHVPGGSTVAAFWLLMGFSFFGKNFFNIWPVMLGGYVYARLRREPFEKYAVVAMLATALSPVVSQIFYAEELQIAFRVPFAIIVGVVMGIVMSPVSSHAMHTHHGYNLYNVGFAAGVMSLLVRVMTVSMGMDVRPVLYWNTEHKLVLSVFLCVIFVFLIGVGLLCGESRGKNLRELSRRTGRLASDFLTDYGESCYINMGVLGLCMTALVLLLGGDINGPVMAGIFTVAGFGCFGKHLKNVWPLAAGCLLGGGFYRIYYEHDPASILAVLFGTCLAPIAGRFGWVWGLVAGIVHFNLSVNIVEFTGGFNLYSNGLAGGLVVMFLLPLIRELRDAHPEEHIHPGDEEFEL